MSAVMQFTDYPVAIAQKLRQVRRRHCALAAARALLLGAAVLLAAMLSAMTIDWSFTLFSTAVRTLLTVSAVGAGFVTLGAAAIRPVIAALGLKRAAGEVDRATPQLEERWSTLASFVESNHRPDSSAIGRAMLQQVSSEAVALGQLVQPARVASPKQLQRAAVLFVTAATVVAAFLAINWQHNRVLLRRFWLPLANITATQLECVSGDLVVPRGEPVELVVRISGLPRETATIVFASDSAENEIVNLAPSAEQPAHFTYYVAALESSFRYRVQSGDGRTAWHSVTAIDRPALAHVKMTLTAPAYVDRPVYEKNYLPARVQAIQGSHLRLEMQPEAKLKSFVLRIALDGKNAEGPEVGAAEQTQRLSADVDGWYRYEAILQQDVTITPVLLSPHGLTTEDAQKCSIRVIPDRAPIARVISPTDEMSVSPDEVVKVKFEAHDDHGIAKAELVIYEESPIEGEPPTILSVEDVPLGDQQNAPHVLATTKLDLAKYDLREGTRVSYSVRVTDNRIAVLEQNLGPKQESTLSARDSEPISGHDGPVADAGAEAKPQNVSSAGENASRPRGPGNKEPLGETDVAASSSNAKKEDTPEQTAAGQTGTDRGAQLPASPESPASAQSDDRSTDTQSTPARGDAGQDKQLAETSSKPAPGEEASSSKQPAVANDASTGTVAPTDSEPKSNGESPGAEPETQSADADTIKPEPSKVASISSIGAVARKDDQPPGDNRSLVSGDLTTVNRRANMTDDLPGEFVESNRLRLKIEQKVISASEPGTNRETIQMKIRGRLEQIDHELKPAEEVLSSLLASVAQSGIADPQIQELNGVDRRLATVDKIIADLRNESKETPYVFVGLHMVDIGTTHITPARDRVFALIRQPDVETHGNSAEALQRVSRARELLAELLVRYDRVLREERLADAIEQTSKFYEVYVANLHRFLRAQAKPNPNPLERKMAIVDVDQEYLDRLREVTEMRRDLMAEFARMLADDPRLLSKYMDLIKRRQTSLRDRLTELHERQKGIATELSGWLRVDETQRDDVWMLAAEVRLQDVAPLAQEASQLQERTTSQFPLSLDPKQRNSSAVIEDAKQLAVRARTAAANARRLLRDPLDPNVKLASDVEAMAFWLAELDAAIERLAFDNANEEATDYADKRLAESRTLFERVVGWTEIAAHLQARRFSGLATVDQRRLALQTELLRIDMQNIDQQLATQFRGEVSQAVTELANELKQLTETITFNQAAATFDLESERLAEAESQQALALEGFKQAEELFDRLRRTVIEELDQIDPPDPNVADLEDPTLDQLLEQLEREPDLNALLGLPDRPQNLRVISDFFASAEGDVPVPSALAQAAEQARARVEEEEKEARRMRQQADEDDDMPEEEWRKVADAEEAQQKLQEKIDELKRRAADPRTEPEEAEKLRQMAGQLEQMRQQLAGRRIDKQQWEEMIRSDQMQAVLRAAARGEPLPDSQWNRLMSSLDQGLWQVRRRTPPEDYRRAIEQYQERLRKLMNLETADVGQ